MEDPSERSGQVRGVADREAHGTQHVQHSHGSDPDRSTQIIERPTVCTLPRWWPQRWQFFQADVFEQPMNRRGTLFRRLQDRLQKLTGVAPVLFFGRGIFNYTFGLLPRRRPINVVVGAPVLIAEEDVGENASAALVDKYHAKYIAALEKLHADHTEQYGNGCSLELF